MRCSRCNSENSAGVKVCGACGAPLPFACPSCGVSNPSDNKFCGQCGARLTPSSSLSVARRSAGLSGGEIKQVTVLFCDIVNSTALTTRLGAEAMRDLV